MGNQNLKLTSVKLVPDIYDEFKIKCIKTGLTLQKLLNRSLHLYNTDQSFTKLINDTAVPSSGSNGAI